MSIDIGAQELDFKYKELATAKNFARLLRDVISPGIYKGGELSISSQTVIITPFTALLRSYDADGNKSVHLRTQENIIITIPSTVNGDYTIYAIYAHADSISNFANVDIRVTTDTDVPEEVIFGRAINNGSGVLTSLSYSNRMRGSIDVSSLDELTTVAYPKQNYHIGNRLYNDKRYVKKIIGTDTFTLTGSTFLNKKYISGISSTTTLVVGMQVTGTGIPSNTIITEIDSSTSIWISNKATAANTGTTFTFTPVFDIEIIDSATGGQSSRLTSDITSPRIWVIDDRSMTFADKRAAFKLGDFKDSLSIITPSDNEPWLDINQNYTVLAANWPDLAPFLRSLFGTVGSTTNFSVTVQNSSPSTDLTFSAGDGAAFVLALAEEQLFHGSFANFRTITLLSAIGTLPAGDYPITAINTITNKVTITTPSASGGTGNVRYYPFRIDSATSTTSARWYKIDDAVLKTVGGDIIPYFRFRDRDQGHTHTDAGHAHSSNAIGGYATGLGGANRDGFGTFLVGDAATISNGSASLGGQTVYSSYGTPRIGTTTRERGMAVYKYLFGNTYVA